MTLGARRSGARRGSLLAATAATLIGSAAPASTGQSTEEKAAGEQRPQPSGLFPSRQEQLARLERELARELETTLRTAPGVVAARVHLSLPTPAPLVGTATPQPGKAAVLVQHHGPAPRWSEQQVQALVAGGVQGLAPERVRVLLQEVPPLAAAEAESALEERWVSVGPIVVRSESAGLLRLVLGALSVAGLILVGVVLALWWRLRPLARSSDHLR